MSRPPSPRSTHIPLSIRTTITPTHPTPQQHGQSSSSQPAPQQQTPSSSSAQQYPSYPISISSEKFPKALKLYSKYYLVRGLSQQEPRSAIEPNNRLSIPNVKRAHSLSSPGSSRADTPSVSDSAYDGVTESVVSFTGEESPGSATPNGSTELISFTGERVRQRIRRPLTPVTKAKAALIRHLESCWVCRSRRVPCPLEHHDIDSLEKARQARARTRQRAQSVQQSRSSDASFSNAPSADQPNAGGSQGQMTSLLGVGGGVGQADQFQEVKPFETAHTDSQSSTFATETETDLLTEIPSHPNVAGPANIAMPAMPTMTYTDPYATYQNGQMFPLGVFRGFFYFCAHLDGLCQHPFEDAEALQTHFETHFSYNRIAPAHRYVCSYCQWINNFSSGPCYNCGSENTIETWIYGNFIRVPTYQRYGPDGQDFLRNNSSTPFFSAAGGNGMGTFDFGLGGMDNGNGNFTTGGMNQGGGYYNFQNNNNIGDPSSQGDNDGGNTPRSGGFPQGNWTRTRNRAKASPLTARYWYAKYRHHKFLLLTLLLLVAFTLLFKAHDWVLTKARSITPTSQNPNLPVLGFVGFLASFAMCYTYWSVKKVGVQRVRRAQCVSSFRERVYGRQANTFQRAQRCPLHDLPTFSFHYRQTAPNTFVHGAVIL